MNYSNTEWRDIPNTRYEVNEYGEVRNKSEDKDIFIINRFRKPYINNKGYKMIDLTDNDGKRQRWLVHRLVATQFVSNPNNYPIVLHSDNIKTNTHYSNLSWGTYSENNSHAIRDGLNKVPRPDNRKYFELYNDQESIICHSINEIKEIIHLYGDSRINNYIHRRTPITEGDYKGYYIKSIGKTIETFNDHPLTGE